MSIVIAVGKIEVKVIMDLLGNTCSEHPHPGYKTMSKEADEVTRMFTKIKPLLNDNFLHDALHQECMYGKYKGYVGTICPQGEANLVDLDYSLGSTDNDRADHTSISLVNNTPTDHQVDNQDSC